MSRKRRHFLFSFCTDNVLRRKIFVVLSRSVSCSQRSSLIPFVFSCCVSTKYSCVVFMRFLQFDDALKTELLCYWCGPYDYLAMLSTCKFWWCVRFLRDAACFAVSRMHSPGGASAFTMEQWNSVWRQCVNVFNARGWPIALWKNASKV